MENLEATAVAAAAVAAGSTARAWWRSAVIYQVYPRSFADGDGDGIGDLPGITGRLPYLAGLGVDAVWLSPFYRSPMVDGGYDVADHRDIDPMFGTLADFDAMLAEAHRLGLRVIIDIVPNHTSSAHPWFAEALAARPGSSARDRYVFRPGRGTGGEQPPNDWPSVFGGPAWTRCDDGEWYLHLFDAAQPDLNWRNPEVAGEFAGILRFWLDRGVDGFRIDVAHGLVKAAGLPDAGAALAQTGPIAPVNVPYFDQDGVHEIYREWRKILDSYPGERIAVAEAWVANPERVARYVASDELHQAFNFHFLMAPWSPARLREVIDASLATAGRSGAPTTWVLANHDTQRMITRYGDGEVGLRRARAALLLMLALPGSAYLYQGDELGLPEVPDLPDEARQDPVWFRSAGERPGRDGCRVPMPWSGDTPPFGFSPPGSAAPWLPVPARWASLTVARQAADPGSTLSLVRRALRVRREHPVLGGLRWLDAPEGVLVFTRGPGLTCAVNLTGDPVRLPVPGDPLVASGPAEGGLLPGDTAAWWAYSPK